MSLLSRNDVSNRREEEDRKKETKIVTDLVISPFSKTEDEDLLLYIDCHYYWKSCWEMGKNHGTKMQMPHFSQTLATELRDHRSFAFLTDQLTRILLAEHFIVNFILFSKSAFCVGFFFYNVWFFLIFWFDFFLN